MADTVVPSELALALAEPGVTYDESAVTACARCGAASAWSETAQ